MPSACCAVDCTNRNTPESGLVFYRIPKRNVKQRELWLKAIKRENWSGNKLSSAKLCSAHFISGKKSDNPDSPDYVPSIFVHKSYDKRNKSQKCERYDRVMKRRSIPSSKDVVDSDDNVDSDNNDEEENEPELVTTLKAENEKLKKLLTQKTDELHQNQTYSVNRVLEIQLLKKEVKEAKKTALLYQNIKTNTTMFLFYTGINKKIFNWILKWGPKKMVIKKLKIVDHLLLTIVKLRTGFKNKDLGYRFNISSAAVSRILKIWLPNLAKFMTDYAIYWPEKYALREHLPSCFKKNYSKCVCVIDCTEVFIERPFNLNARAKTWSNYKNHNTIKYLVGCAPSGAVNYLSDGWGGRVSDKEITNRCGFLDLIENGDQVLADRGFTVGEEVACKGGVLIIPSFTKGKSQLSAKDVDKSRQIANVRIHIERVIGRMRKFNIINSTIPISQVKLLDNIMVAIAGLVNLCDTIV